MAVKVAIVGTYNSGKSYSRQFLKKGEESFLISPSSKSSHMTDSSGKPVDELNIAIGVETTFDGVCRRLGVKTRHEVIRAFMTGGLPKEAVITGNYAVVPDIHDIPMYMQFIDQHMPHIKNIFVGDFTHYITHEITGEAFRARKRGDEAFARYIDLAADSLHNVLIAPDKLKRKDIVVLTEYHDKYDPDRDSYRIFVPAGNMLSDKIKPETYYDYFLCTHVLNYDEERDDTKRFKFVITKKDRYDGRMAGLFNDIAKDGMIPNDIQIVIDRIRKREGI